MLKSIGALIIISALLPIKAEALPGVDGLLAPSRCGKYEKFEATFQVATSATNYDWPYDAVPPAGIEAGVGVTVDALFSRDDWATTLVKPGFYYQRYSYENRAGFGEWLYPDGQPSWCVRFSPFAAGVWQWRIRVTDKDGTTLYPSSGDLQFTCDESGKHGPLRVSTTDPRYFEHLDGSPWTCGIGLVDSDYGDLDALEADLPDWGSSGVNLIRTWWQSYSSPSLFGYPRYGLPKPTSAEHMPGHRLSWAIPLTSANQENQLTLDVHVKLNTNYRVSVFAKTSALVGTGTCGVMLWAYDPTWKSVTPGLIGTNDWTEISAVINSGSNYLLHTKAVVENCTSGSVWLSGASIREDLGGGNYGPELVDRTDPEVYRHFPKFTAARCEKMLDLCEASNVWLKIVAEEKQDYVYGRIMADGSYNDAYAPDGTSLYSAAGSANRRYQEYYWRFLIARFGHSPAVHSWELFNEADPFNGNLYLAANAFAKYMHDNNPNRQLVTTSTWHSYPTSEFWANPAYPDIDYSDLHKYVDAVNHYSGLLLNKTQAGKVTNEGAPAINSSRSFRVVSSDGEQYFRKLPVVPGHQYKVSVYIKADNIVWSGPGNNPAAAAFWVRESTGWMGDQNGFNEILTPTTGSATPLAYNWTKYSLTFSAKSNTHFLSMSAHIINASSGTAWYDGITIDDLTTGKVIEVPNGCFEHVDPVCWDSALETYEVGSMHLGLTKDSRHKNAPLIRGETGISDPTNDSDESPYLFNDTANLWFKKKVWAQIGPAGVIEMPWWREKLNPTRRWTAAKPYYEFMRTISINNGHYEHVAATVSNPLLRVYGQKDLVNNRAHLWVDNSEYTWKAVLDHDYPPLAWAGTWTFPLDGLCSSGTPLRVYKSLQASNKNHAVTDGAWWEDLGEFNAADNPALPAAVTGTVTVSGMRDGAYKAEWWDTTAGQITRTDSVASVGGSIVLAVQNLASDIACKVYPVAPRVQLTISVPSNQVIPGQAVTVTVNFSNTGDAGASNVVVKATVPDQMNYVAGSGEASGGTYVAEDRSVRWTITSLAAGQNGTRTFTATVK